MTKENQTKGGILIPITDFITTILNIPKQDIQTLDVVKLDNKFIYHLTLVIKNFDCPYCGGSTTAHDKRKRLIKHPTLIDYDGSVIWNARRYRCNDCKSTFLEKNPFSFEGFSISYEVGNRIMKDLKNINYTYYDIAKKNYVSPTTVQRYFDSWVNVPRITLPESLGIDELHSDMAKYGSSFLCVMVDNEKRSLIEILPSRKKDYLNKYFDKIPHTEKSRVKYVTIDMWEPYKDVALRHFKNCVVAVDPFHVIKHLSDSFSRIRINIMNQVQENSDTYYLLKTWHRLLESNVKLDNEPVYNHRFKKKLNYRNLYDMLLGINENLTSAYQLKEMYRKFNKEASDKNCEIWFNQVYEAFTVADIPEYYDFLQTLSNWKPEILNSFKRPYDDRKLSNALAENINGSIRTYLSVSNGNANFERFRKRVIYALNDHIFYSITKSQRSLKRDFPKRGAYQK